MRHEHEQNTKPNFDRVKHRFTSKKGVVRNSWCKLSVKEMALAVGGESMYGGIYSFGSSLTHTDILGVIAGRSSEGNVENVPSGSNVALALQITILSHFMSLTALNHVGGLGMDEPLAVEWARFKQVSSSPVWGTPGHNWSC